MKYTSQRPGEEATLRADIPLIEGILRDDTTREALVQAALQPECRTLAPQPTPTAPKLELLSTALTPLGNLQLADDHLEWRPENHRTLVAHIAVVAGMLQMHVQLAQIAHLASDEEAILAGYLLAAHHAYYFSRFAITDNNIIVSEALLPPKAVSNELLQLATSSVLALAEMQYVIEALIKDSTLRALYACRYRLTPRKASGRERSGAAARRRENRDYTLHGSVSSSSNRCDN